VTVEEVYTDAFDATYVAWTETGASPYLNDSDANYIYTSLTAKSEGHWTFPASAGSGAINSVKLRFKVKAGSYGDSSSAIVVKVWNGASWVTAGTIYLDSTVYGWKEIDVSAILDTWAKINGAKVHVTSAVTAPLDPDPIYCNRLTRKVDYTAAAGQQLFTLINEEDY